MNIKIFGAESLGVRGLSCSVELKDGKVFIDPGIALGWSRHGLMPHPFQVAVGAEIRSRIIEELKTCTDVIISHFDGDHCPLYNANQFQMKTDDVRESLLACRIWAMGSEDSSSIQQTRRNKLSECLERELAGAEGMKSGPFQFSIPVPHGRQGKKKKTVMMSRIEDDGEIFVHASDIQLVDNETVDIIIDWKPDTVLVSGPPLYHYSSSAFDEERHAALENALRLSRNVSSLIIDHHLLRSEEGINWLDNLRDNASCRVMCAADFMNRPRLFLEAWRQKLYECLHVPDTWHEDYKNGIITADEYLEKGFNLLSLP